MDYQNAINKLVGLPLAKIGRAADLLWLQFGTLRQVTTKHGDKSVGDQAVHVQTSWRFVRDAKIILAVGDLYLLPNGDYYDWDVGGDSNFDILARDLNDLFSSASVVVLNAQCDDLGGFSLALSDGTRFDVFPKLSDTIGEIEHWRMFQPGANCVHTVCQTRNRDTNAG